VTEQPVLIIWVWPAFSMQCSTSSANFYCMCIDRISSDFICSVAIT